MKRPWVWMGLGFLMPVAFVVWITWLAYREGFQVFEGP